MMRMPVVIMAAMARLVQRTERRAERLAFLVEKRCQMRKR